MGWGSSCGTNCCAQAGKARRKTEMPVTAFPSLGRISFAILLFIQVIMAVSACLIQTEAFSLLLSAVWPYARQKYVKGRMKSFILCKFTGNIKLEMKAHPTNPVDERVPC
jgi:hypothetical protein